MSSLPAQVWVLKQLIFPGQLDRIGTFFGHIPDWNGLTPAHKTGPHGITHKDLLAAAEDQHTFDKLYVMITNKAIEHYAIGAGRRSALKLHASLALLDRYGYSLHVPRISS
jgi:hypothetical protein